VLQQELAAGSFPPNDCGCEGGETVFRRLSLAGKSLLTAHDSAVSAYGHIGFRST
jgi:hypothetical protein